MLRSHAKIKTNSKGARRREQLRSAHEVLFLPPWSTVVIAWDAARIRLRETGWNTVCSPDFPVACFGAPQALFEEPGRAVSGPLRAVRLAMSGECPVAYLEQPGAYRAAAMDLSRWRTVLTVMYQHR